jgi:hypothetical protein
MLVSDPSWRESRQADGYYARPELDEALTFYLHAWFDLAGDRREAMAQIPFTAIALYAERSANTSRSQIASSTATCRGANADGDHLA